MLIATAQKNPKQTHLSPEKKYVYPLGSHQIAVSILCAGTPCPYW